MNNNKYSILLVEDSDEDFEATVRAFKKSGMANNIIRCIDGDDALDYLYQRNKYSDGEYNLPNIILLDLNLPGTDGREVLETIKSDEKIASIPVVVLTTSNDVKDIDFCYAKGANSYIQKPVDLNRFVEAIKRLEDYWFEIVVLPRES